MRDFYSVLDVAPKAKDAEIKAAFRNLAKTCHPDVRPGDRGAEETFQEAKRAYRFLANAETRKIYDAFLADRRAAKRLRLRRAATTMSASFLLTAATVLLAAAWLHDGGLSLGVGRSIAQERTSAMEVARAATSAPAAEETGDIAGPALTNSAEKIR
jgi:DnaJ-class molecular chaperone